MFFRGKKIQEKKRHIQEKMGKKKTGKIRKKKNTGKNGGKTHREKNGGRKKNQTKNREKNGGKKQNRDKNGFVMLLMFCSWAELLRTSWCCD